VPFEECESVRHARQLAIRLAKSRIPIYISGESGAGRRTLARAAVRAIVGATDCVQLSQNNFDPLLLAPPQRRTRVVIAEFPELLESKCQVALAIAAETRAVQLVAWGAEVGPERLNPELRYLLQPGWVLLPPLRDRGKDVLKWALVFLHHIRGDGAPRLSAQAEEAVLAHPWPGNLRQLDTTLRRAVLRREAGDRSSITADELIELLKEDSPSVLPLAEAVERFRHSYVLDALARFDGDHARTAEALRVDPKSLANLDGDAEPPRS
jgi:DNA-binding NtrC family response regulator